MRRISLGAEATKESPDKISWGRASERRGRRHIDLAKAFVADFPVGTRITTTEFDLWLHKHELLNIPPNNAPKDSDAWMGHLQRRHQARNQINSSANHPRMTDEGSNPFLIVAKGGQFEVLAPEIAVGLAQLPKKFRSLAKTKRKQLSHLMQSADWSVLPPYERIFVEGLYDDINAFVMNTNAMVGQLDLKFSKFRQRLQTMVESGSVMPQEGMRRLIDNYEEDDDIEEEPENS